jgi:transcription initiation factor IIF auxiliary subunit
VINFWDEWELSYDEFLSPTADQQPTKWKTVYFEHFHTAKSEVVDYSLGYDILFKHYSEENIALNSYRVNMWDEWTLSNNVAVSPIEEENRKTVFFTHAPSPHSIIIDYLYGFETNFAGTSDENISKHQIAARYWDEWTMSENVAVSPDNEENRKTIFMAHSHTPTTYSVNYSEDVNFFFDNLSEENINLTKSTVAYWDEWTMSENVAVSPDNEENRKTLFTVHTPSSKEISIDYTEDFGVIVENLSEENIELFSYLVDYWRVTSLSEGEYLSDSDTDTVKGKVAIFSKHTSE